MKTTVSPTRTMAAIPARRTTLVTPSSLSYCSWRVVIRSISGRSARAAATESPMTGSVRSTSMLAYRLIWAPPVSSSWPRSA